PNTKARAEFEQFQRDQGITEDALHRPASQVTVKWREEHALAPAVVERDGPLVDLDDRVLLEQLADTHAALLHQYKMPQLDLTQITSKIRPVTQATSRDLYDRGAAGLLFRSNHDALRCIVLFEGRARLIADGRPTPMTKNHSALVRVCGEYGLVLRSPSSSRTRRRKWQP
ncbi:MAG TPA: RES domain-containing protein, partial [Nitrolancea sp.]|nr:RES domain-containing protein [Nitrolancea sp.]